MPRSLHPSSNPGPGRAALLQSALPLQPTALIGREREVAEVCALLRRDDVRLLTLSGPPGTGKTRLAMQAAADLRADFPGGVHFVPLAPIRDPGLVLSEVAQALQIKEIPGRSLSETLAASLYDASALLLLDNFEQVVAAAPALAGMLAQCPGLKMLVTSREVLRLRGEHEFQVPPLSLPPEGLGAGRGEITQGHEAITLFVQRARAAKRSFRLTPGNAAAVAAICRRLDGLPLAIELAAARINALTPQAMLDRLGRRLDLLTSGPHDLPERQQTLSKAIEWSYDLLTPDEQALFRSLAVFRGGCTLRAVEVVCFGGSEPGPGGTALDTVTSLINKSLLQQEEGEQQEPRYSMLETLQEYASALLGIGAGAELLRQAHATYFLAMAEEAERELRGPAQGAWIERLGIEHDNMRAALDWCSATPGTAGLGLRLAGALGLFWRVRGHLTEGRERMLAALASAESALESGGPGQQALSARVYGEAGWLYFVQGSYEQARELCARSLDLYRLVGDERGAAGAMVRLGAIHGHLGEYNRAQEMLHRGLELSRAVSDSYGISTSLNILGELARLQGAYDQAARSYRESYEIKLSMGGKMGIAVAQHNLARVALHQGDTGEAEALFRSSLAAFLDLGSRLDVAMCAAGLGGVAAATGRPERAAHLLGAASALLTEIGASVWPADRSAYEQDVAAARALLPGPAFDAAWAEGRAMRLEDAAAYALEEGSRPTGAAPSSTVTEVSADRVESSRARSDMASLTPREVDVLRLVAAGMSNAQVGERLVVSPNTVAMHLYSIYSKLGVKSRTAAARVAIEHHLV